MLVPVRTSINLGMDCGCQSVFQNKASAQLTHGTLSCHQLQTMVSCTSMDKAFSARKWHSRFSLEVITKVTNNGMHGWAHKRFCRLPSSVLLFLQLPFNTTISPRWLEFACPANRHLESTNNQEKKPTAYCAPCEFLKNSIKGKTERANTLPFMIISCK